MVFKRVLCNCREKEEFIRTSKIKASPGHLCDKHVKIKLLNKPPILVSIFNSSIIHCIISTADISPLICKQASCSKEQLFHTSIELSSTGSVT